MAACKPRRDFAEAVAEIRQLTRPLIDKRARRNAMAVAALAQGRLPAKQENICMRTLIRKRKEQRQKVKKLQAQGKEAQVRLLRTAALDCHSLAQKLRKKRRK